MQYAQLGDVVFELLSYREHSEENEYIYARKETAFPPSILQSMGTELQKLTLGVKWHREWCNPREEYEKLKSLANKGEPAKLIIASQIIGNYVIQKISAQYEQIDVWGKPVEVSCRVELTEYREKELKTKRIKMQGPAVKKKPIKVKLPQYKPVKVKNADGVEFTVLKRVE